MMKLKEFLMKGLVLELYGKIYLVIGFAHFVALVRKISIWWKFRFNTIEPA
jgi:hypothetical protein